MCIRDRGISCYLWNIEYVGQLLRELPKILPDTKIWLGGPEVSYDAKAVLELSLIHI